MAMKKIETAEGKMKGNYLQMSDMMRGDVCYCERDKRYVVCVGHGIQPNAILILDDNGSMNTYNGTCYLQVRRLYDGESVTIKFS